MLDRSAEKFGPPRSRSRSRSRSRVSKNLLSRVESGASRSNSAGFPRTFSMPKDGKPCPRRRFNKVDIHFPSSTLPTWPYPRLTTPHDASRRPTTPHDANHDDAPPCAMWGARRGTSGHISRGGGEARPTFAASSAGGILDSSTASPPIPKDGLLEWKREELPPPLEPAPTAERRPRGGKGLLPPPSSPDDRRPRLSSLLLLSRGLVLASSCPFLVKPPSPAGTIQGQRDS